MMQEPAGSEATSAQEGEIAHGSTIDKELSAQAAQAEGLALHALPPTVLRKVLLHLNPGNAIQLALSSKQLRQAVMFESSGYWEAMALSSGWRPHAEGRTQQAPLDTEQQWFDYYSQRMMCRWRIRRFLRLYTQFLNRASQMALNPGASPERLGQAEQALGVGLPWELWELLRYRNGQAPASGVVLLDDMRLLSTEELVVEHVHVTSAVAQTEAQHRAAEALGAVALPSAAPPQVPHGPLAAATACTSLGAPGPSDPLMPPPTSSALCEVCAVRFASNSNSTRVCLQALDTGSILLRRGFSTFVIAPSLSRWLQKLLT